MIDLQMPVRLHSQYCSHSTTHCLKVPRTDTAFPAGLARNASHKRWYLCEALRDGKGVATWVERNSRQEDEREMDIHKSRAGNKSMTLRKSRTVGSPHQSFLSWCHVTPEIKYRWRPYRARLILTRWNLRSLDLHQTPLDPKSSTHSALRIVGTQYGSVR